MNRQFDVGHKNNMEFGLNRTVHTLVTPEVRNSRVRPERVHKSEATLTSKGLLLSKLNILSAVGKAVRSCLIIKEGNSYRPNLIVSTQEEFGFGRRESQDSQHYSHHPKGPWGEGGHLLRTI